MLTQKDTFVFKRNTCFNKKYGGKTFYQKQLGFTSCAGKEFSTLNTAVSHSPYGSYEVTGNYKSMEECLIPPNTGGKMEVVPLK